MDAAHAVAPRTDRSHVDAVLAGTPRWTRIDGETQLSKQVGQHRI